MNRKNIFLFFILGIVSLTGAEAAWSAADTGIFTGKDAAATIADALAKDGAGNDIKVTITEAREDDILSQGGHAVTAETDAMDVDKAHNHWQALLLLKSDGRNLAPIKLSGRYDEMTAIPIMKKPIPAGEVITQGDIDFDKQPLAHLRKNTVTDARDLIGKSPKHTISQGRPIRLDEISSPAIVNKGGQVTLFYKTPNMEIKTYGEAMDSGGKGDVIRVRNSASKAIIQGTVEAPERVRVSSPDTDSAEAM